MRFLDVVLWVFVLLKCKPSPKPEVLSFLEKVFSQNGFIFLWMHLSLCPDWSLVLGTVAERHDAQSGAATTVFDCRDGVNEAGTFQRCRNGSPIGLCTDTMLSRRSVELIAYFFPSLDMTQFPSVQVSQLNIYL